MASLSTQWHKIKLLSERWSKTVIYIWQFCEATRQITTADRFLKLGQLNLPRVNLFMHQGLSLSLAWELFNYVYQVQ